MHFSSAWTAGAFVVAGPVIVTARSVLPTLIRRIALPKALRDGGEVESRLPPNVIDPKSLLEGPVSYAKLDGTALVIAAVAVILFLWHSARTRQVTHARPETLRSPEARLTLLQ